jgi:hypothetical protein
VERHAHQSIVLRTMTKPEQLCHCLLYVNVLGTHALYFGLAPEKSLLRAKRYGEPHELIVSLSTGVVIPAVAGTVAWHHCSSMLESSPWL